MSDLMRDHLKQRQGVSESVKGFPETFRRNTTEEPSSRSQKLKILFVAAGGGRSGKTLFSRLVGEMDGCTNVGELRELINGIAENNCIPCGCGDELASCLLWKEVKEVLPREVQEYAKRWMRMRWFLLYLVSLLGAPPTWRFRRYLQTLETIYAEIARQTGCSVIVDSSTSPTYLCALMRLLNVEVYVLHLVRSPQAVAMSWSRKKEYLAPQSALKTLIAWLIENICFESLGRSTGEYRRIRYEDFVEEPEKTLRSVTEWIFRRPMALPFVSRNRALIHEQHHLAGNPDKFAAGEIVIRQDTAIPAPLHTRILTHLLTFPLLWHYKYL